MPIKLPQVRPASVQIAAGTNNVPTAFAAAAGSKTVTGLGGKGYTHLMVINETATRIAVLSDASATVAPSASSTERFFVAANSSLVLDDFPIQDTVYVQSDASAISSGTVNVTVW